MDRSDPDKSSTPCTWATLKRMRLPCVGRWLPGKSVKERSCPVRLTDGLPRSSPDRLPPYTRRVSAAAVGGAERGRRGAQHRGSPDEAVRRAAAEPRDLHRAQPGRRAGHAVRALVRHRVPQGGCPMRHLRLPARRCVQSDLNPASHHIPTPAHPTHPYARTHALECLLVLVRCSTS